MPSAIQLKLNLLVVPAHRCLDLQTTTALDYYIIIHPESWTVSLPNADQPATLDSARVLLAAEWSAFQQNLVNRVRLRLVEENTELLPTEPVGAPADIQPYQWTPEQSAQFLKLLQNCQIGPDAPNAENGGEAIPPITATSLPAALDSAKVYVQVLRPEKSAETARGDRSEHGLGESSQDRAALNRQPLVQAAVRAAQLSPSPAAGASPPTQLESATQSLRKIASFFTHNRPERELLGFCRRIRVQLPEPWSSSRSYVYRAELISADSESVSLSIAKTPIAAELAVDATGLRVHCLADQAPRLVANPAAPQTMSRVPLHRGVVPMKNWFAARTDTTRSLHLNLLGPGDDLDLADQGESGIQIVRLNPSEADGLLPNAVELGAYPLPDRSQICALPELANAWTLDVRPRGGGKWSCLFEQNFQRDQKRDAPPYILPSTRGHQPFDVKDFGYIALSWVSSAAGVERGPTGVKTQRALIYWYILRTPVGEFLYRSPEIPSQEPWPQETRNAQEFEMLSALLQPGNWLYARVTDKNRPLASEGFLGIRNGTTLAAYQSLNGSAIPSRIVPVEFDGDTPADGAAVVAQGSWQLDGNVEPYRPEMATFVASDSPLSVTIAPSDWPNDRLELTCQGPIDVRLRDQSPIALHQLGAAGRPVTLRLCYENGKVAGAAEKGARIVGSMHKGARGELLFRDSASHDYLVEWAEDAVVSDALLEWFRVRPKSPLAKTLVEESIDLTEPTPVRIEGVETASSAAPRIRVHRAEFYPDAQLGVLRSATGHTASFVPYHLGALGWPERDVGASPMEIDVSAPLGQKHWQQDGVPLGQLVWVQWSSPTVAKVIRLANSWMAGQVLNGAPYAAGPKESKFYLEIEAPSGGPRRFDVDKRILNAASVGGWLLFARFIIDPKTGPELSAAFFKARLWWRGERDTASAVFYDSAGRAIAMALTIKTDLPHGRSPGDHGYYDVSYTVTAQHGAVLDHAEPLDDAAVPGLFRATTGVWSQLLVTPDRSSFVRASRGYDDRIVRVGKGLLKYVLDQASAGASAPLWIQVRRPTWSFQVGAHRPVARVTARAEQNPRVSWRCQTVRGQCLVFLPGSRLAALPCVLQSGPPENDDKPEWKEIQSIVLIIDYDKVSAKLLADPSKPSQPVLAKRFKVVLADWRGGSPLHADDIANEVDAPSVIEMPPSGGNGVVATGVLCEWAGSSFVRESDQAELKRYTPIWKAIRACGTDVPIRYGVSYEFRLRLVDPAGQAREDAIDTPADCLSHTFQRSARIAAPRLALVATRRSPPPPPPPPPAPQSAPKDLPLPPSDETRLPVTAPVIPAASPDSICSQNEWPELLGGGITGKTPAVYQTDEGRRVTSALGIRKDESWAIYLFPPSSGYEICERAGAFDRRDILASQRAALYNKLREEGLLGRNSHVRRSPNGKDTQTEPTTPIFQDAELKYLPDPFVRGARLRVRFVGEEYSTGTETAMEATWWSQPPSQWGAAPLRTPRKLGIEVETGRQLRLSNDGERIVLTVPAGRRAILGITPLLFEPQSQVAIGKSTIEAAKTHEAERMVYHAVRFPERPPSAPLKVKRLDPLRETEATSVVEGRLPPREAGSLRVECVGRVRPQTTGRLMIEWAKETWTDDPNSPLPVLPAEQLDRFFDPLRSLTGYSGGRPWSEWIDLINPRVPRTDLVAAGCPEEAITYLEGRIAESRDGVYHAALESNILRDGGLGSEADERTRSELQTVTGRYSLGGRGVVFGRHRLMGWTRFDVAEPQSSSTELQKEVGGYRLLQLNHDRLEKPIVAYMIPLIYEEQRHPEQRRYTSKLHNAGYRIFLERPWFVSGPGELIAVLFAKPGEGLENSTHWAVDPVWAATQPRQKGGDVVPWTELSEDGLFAQTPKAHQGPYANMEAMAAALNGFERKTDTLGSGAAWRLKHLWATAYGKSYDPALDPSGVAYPVAFSVERGLWYIDVPLPPPIMFGMFVQLVLARVQPLSSIGATLEDKARFISDPIVLHYCSLSPDRSVEIVRDISGWDHSVTLRGLFPDDSAELPFSDELWLSIELQLLQYTALSSGGTDPVSFVKCNLEESGPGIGRVGAPSDGRQNKIERVRLKWDAVNRCYSGRLELQRSFFNGKQKGLHSANAHIVLEEILTGDSDTIRLPELGSPTPLVISATRVPIAVE